MAKLFFIPWYSPYREITIGNFRLVPWKREDPNNQLGNLTDPANVILDAYVEASHTPAALREFKVKQATIILPMRDPIKESDLEALQYVVALCGTSGRTLERNSDYLCTENFKFFIQPFTSPITAEFVPARSNQTKSGSGLTGYSKGMFREVKPFHVSSQNINLNPTHRIQFDERLAVAVWRSFYKASGSEQSKWRNNIFPSLFAYYFANTDGLTNQTECIYAHGAIERLLLGSDFSEQKLIEEMTAFLSAHNVSFLPFQSSKRQWQSITRNNGESQCASILEAWLRELTRNRNAFAHGNADTTESAVWSLTEHLRLASFLFPMLLKLASSVRSLHTPYILDQLTTEKLKRFEILLAAVGYNDECPTDPDYNNWGKIISDARMAAFLSTH